MSSLFVHLEDRTSDFPEGVLITEGDEGESVAAAVAEVTEEERGVEEEDRVMQDMQQDAADADSVIEAVEEAPKTEHYGLTETNAIIVKRVLASVYGSSAGVARMMPKFEHFQNRSDRRTATSMTLESMKDALRNFWEALKRQFQKVWAKIKTWYVKTFSGAKRIADRAKQIRDRAESASSTIENKSFQFSQVATLAISGKLKEASAFEAALGRVKDMVTAASETPTDGALDKLDTALSNISDSVTKEADQYKVPGVKEITKLVTERFAKVASSGGGKGEIEDKVKKSLGADATTGDMELKISEVLPGDKHFVCVSPKNAESDSNKALRATRTLFVNSKEKPREIGSDAEAVTLNNAQISKFADLIVSSAGDIVDYETKWQKVDKAQEKILRRIDEIFKEFQSVIKDDEDATGGKERQTRTLATNLTNFVKRQGSMVSQITSYALNVYAATLNWCEGSMRQVKK